MKKIKLRYNQNSTHIDSPSGNRVTAGQLQVGKIYLQENMIFLRKILSMHDQGLYYSTHWGRIGFCSKQHFVSKCRYEATEDEIKFLFSQESLSDETIGFREVF